jgi:4-hydroxy-tetrahydrodipicolinate reductase
MRIGVTGCTGRMGSAIVRQLIKNPYHQIASGTVRSGSADVGRDIGDALGLSAQNILITPELRVFFGSCDGVIDFTTPEATVHHAKMAAQYKKPLVIGTTGLNEEQKEIIATFAKETPIVHSHNMSIGIVLLSILVEKAAKALDIDFDIEIIETHHRHKLDAPSGTALTLGQFAAKGRGKKLEDVWSHGRFGPNSPRSTGEIGFHAVRGGGVIGEHEVVFHGHHESISLSHRAIDRDLFASGAIKALQWLENKPPALYSMRDVLMMEKA